MRPCDIDRSGAEWVYRSGSYRQSIQRAAKTANVTSLHPYQIRHMTATMVRAAFDSPDFSQALLEDAGYSVPVCVEVEDRVYEGSQETRIESLAQSYRYLSRFVAN